MENFMLTCILVLIFMMIAVVIWVTWEAEELLNNKNLNMKKYLLPSTSWAWFRNASIALIAGIAGVFPLYKGAGNVILGVLGVIAIAYGIYGFIQVYLLKKQGK